jgi:hypothetical protein
LSALGDDSDLSKLDHHPDIVQLALEWFSLGMDKHEVMFAINLKLLRNDDDNMTRRHYVSLKDVQALYKRFRRGSDVSSTICTESVYSITNVRMLTCLATVVDADDAKAVHRIHEILKGLDKPIMSIPCSPTATDPSGAFCALIMAESGVLALQTWGRRIALMDTTYGTNRYGYGLTALIVKDSHGNHFPVAFMIHSEDNSAAFTTFLSYIKEKAGMLPKGILVDNCAAG